MTSTIAVVASTDTKDAEVNYVVEQLAARGARAVIIDVSTSKQFTSPHEASPEHIRREDVATAAGHVWADIVGSPRAFLLDVMARGATRTLRDLHDTGRIHGVLGLGGLQNTTMAAQAMQALPVGFPKVIVSTVACGTRKFDMVAGTKDITVMPAVTDLAGLNFISRRILANAAGAVVGMVEAGGRDIGRPAEDTIGTTLMGATNDGVVQAVAELEAAGRPVCCFHSTGVGGQVLEELVADGALAATMDLTLHEIVYEYFGGGFGAGTTDRLMAGARAGIPMVVAPGGIDFICQWKGELFADVDDRKMIWHNAELAHVKLRENEARDVARLVVERLNAATGPVTVLLPTGGLRTMTRPGEPLHEPTVDAVILDELERGLRADIVTKRVDANLCDPEFSHAAAEEMLMLMSSRTGARR